MKSDVERSKRLIQSAAIMRSMVAELVDLVETNPTVVPEDERKLILDFIHQLSTALEETVAELNRFKRVIMKEMT